MIGTFQTILLDHATIDGDYVRFAVETRETFSTGDRSNVTFVRVPRENFRQLVARIAVLEDQEQDEPAPKWSA